MSDGRWLGSDGWVPMARVAEVTAPAAMPAHAFEAWASSASTRLGIHALPIHTPSPSPPGLVSMALDLAALRDRLQDIADAAQHLAEVERQGRLRPPIAALAQAALAAVDEATDVLSNLVVEVEGGPSAEEGAFWTPVPKWAVKAQPTQRPLTLTAPRLFAPETPPPPPTGPPDPMVAVDGLRWLPTGQEIGAGPTWRRRP